MDKELIVVKGKVIEQQRSYTAEVGKDISYEAGAKMVKRQYDQSPDDVMAQFMGRNAIEAILNQPGCVGIRMFHALNELGIKQMVLVGVDKNGNNILEFDTINPEGRITKNSGVIKSGGKLCPPYCGDTSTTTTTTSNWW